MAQPLLIDLGHLVPLGNQKHIVNLDIPTSPVQLEHLLMMVVRQEVDLIAAVPEAALVVVQGVGLEAIHEVEQHLGVDQDHAACLVLVLDLAAHQEVDLDQEVNQAAAQDQIQRVFLIYQGKILMLFQTVTHQGLDQDQLMEVRYK